MSKRSANAKIKGYFYQFKHTIIQILSLSHDKESLIVEGVEDIDLLNKNSNNLLQCKYYESQSYNHSKIKEAIIEMIKHFHENGCQTNQSVHYHIYAHFKDGTDKLPETIEPHFLKKHFLKIKGKNPKDICQELNLSNQHLIDFLSILHININACNYDDEKRKVEKLLIREMLCKEEEVDFFYCKAMDVIRELAIKKDKNDRKTTKTEFINAVNQKQLIFNFWLQQAIDENAYAKIIKKQLLASSSGIKVEKKERFFIIDLSHEFSLSSVTELIKKISCTFSHKECKRTPDDDRFCPYVFLRGISGDELISIKKNIYSSGIKFEDGYPFKGAEFDLDTLIKPPTKENLIRLRILEKQEHIPEVIAAIKNKYKVLYSFYKEKPIDNYLSCGIPYHQIKIDSVRIIMEAI